MEHQPRLEEFRKEVMTDMNPKEQARVGWRQVYRMCCMQSRLQGLDSRGEREGSEFRELN